MLFLAIPCPLRHSREDNLRKPLRLCRDPDPNAEGLERFIWRGFYYRVSTGKQDIEMPAQRAAVEAFLNGGGWKIIGEEVKVETGTKTDAQRPKLAKALAIAKKHKATLVIAKLDRLARDTHFITGLQKSGVSFLCCDNPHANKMTIQLLAVVAEHERDQIAARTSAGLQAKKASGKPWISKKSGRLVERLGSPNPPKGAEKSVAVRKKAANEFASKMLPIIDAIRARGLTTLAQIAEELTRQKWPTARGAEAWSMMAVSNILKRKLRTEAERAAIGRL